ncbi:hypothetical protein [Chitinophaga sancti]|uniref:hypothetical protein n=1 Tax=Chitinophaga sancti TaxID=1004 RepID=UPI003F7A95FC
MKQFAIILLSLLLTLTSFCQTPSEQLLMAYKSNSPTAMDSFFNTWKKNTILSHTALESMNDTVQNIYQVYKKFYDPNATDSINHDKYLGIYQIQSIKYFLLQNWMTYGIVDTLDRELLMKDNLKFLARRTGVSIDSVNKKYLENTKRISSYFLLNWPTPKKSVTIDHFYPQVSFSVPETLTLTKQYNDLIWAFLLEEYVKAGKKATIESLVQTERFQFLEKYFRVWNGILDLCSPPKITSITFDRHLENALVNYDEVSSGGYGYFKKINGDWILIEAKTTWQH